MGCPFIYPAVDGKGNGEMDRTNSSAPGHAASGPLVSDRVPLDRLQSNHKSKPFL